MLVSSLAVFHELSQISRGLELSDGLVGRHFNRLLLGRFFGGLDFLLVTVDRLSNVKKAIFVPVRDRVVTCWVPIQADPLLLFGYILAHLFLSQLCLNDLQIAG